MYAVKVVDEATLEAKMLGPHCLHVLVRNRLTADGGVSVLAGWNSKTMSQECSIIQRRSTTSKIQKWLDWNKLDVDKSLAREK